MNVDDENIYYDEHEKNNVGMNEFKQPLIELRDVGDDDHSKCYRQFYIKIDFKNDKETNKIFHDESNPDIFEEIAEDIIDFIAKLNKKHGINIKKYRMIRNGNYISTLNKNNIIKIKGDAIKDEN